MAFPRVQTSRGELRIHESLDDLSTDLVEYISELSDASVKERGVFTIAISGGSLIGLLGKLSEAPYNKTIDWVKWYIFWVDERVVAKSHSDSNYKLAKEGLLTKGLVWAVVVYAYVIVSDQMVPVIPSHVHSINDSLSAEDAASEYEFGIRQLVKTRLINVSDVSDCPKFDLILVGMGPDGHVASLFPGHHALGVKEEWVTFITDSPKPPPERITFTMPVINSASNVVVVVTGGEKAEAVHQAINANANDDSVPARMISPARGKLVWFLDKQAAVKLEAAE
ncbi:putative 6-phosphogluconolactonase 2 [Bienertia sinuspersici]